MLEDAVRQLQHRSGDADAAVVRSRQTDDRRVAGRSGRRGHVDRTRVRPAHCGAKRVRHVCVREHRLSGDYGGSWLLTQLVGVASAKELYYTSRRVGAEEGLALGIFNEVVADDELMARARALAESIAAGPPIALRYMKENLNRAVGADLRSALALEADRMVRCTRTDDHREAVQAFIGKRKPDVPRQMTWQENEAWRSTSNFCSISAVRTRT